MCLFEYSNDSFPLLDWWNSKIQADYLCVVFNAVLCFVFSDEVNYCLKFCLISFILIIFLNMDMSEDASGVQNTRTVPTRVCQTCGEAKSLDHFVSMYTEASTTNCDLCRKKQREVYRCI